MKRLAALFLALVVLPSFANAEGSASIGPFAISESTSCSGDCGGDLDRIEGEYGASLLFTDRYGWIGGFVELGWTNQSPYAAIGPAFWAGDLRFMAGASMLSDKAEYDFGGAFGKTETSDRAAGILAEIAWKGVFVRYTFYRGDHKFRSTVNNTTRSAEADITNQAVWGGYRFRLPF